MEYSVYSVPKLYKIEDIDNKKTYTVGNAFRDTDFVKVSSAQECPLYVAG